MSENVLPMFSSRSFMVSCPIIVRPFWVYCCALCEVGEGNDTPLQHSCLENPMDGGAWYAAVHGVAKSWTRLSDFTFTHWRRKWQPTPVFLPGESQGRGSLVGCRLLGSQSRTRLKWLSVVWGVNQLHWFTYNCPAFSVPLAEETVFSPIVFLPPLSKINWV